MFISRDPIGLLGGFNTFSYAPNPVMWVDPSGLAVYHTNWSKAYNSSKGVPTNYQVHHMIPQAVASEAKKLCASFDVHNKDNLIALRNSKNVNLITKNGYGATIHSGQHLGYNLAVTNLLKGAQRINIPGLNACMKLKAIQKMLRSQLVKGDIPLNNAGYDPKTFSTGDIKKAFTEAIKSSIRNQQ